MDKHPLLEPLYGKNVEPLELRIIRQNVVNTLNSHDKLVKEAIENNETLNQTKIRLMKQMCGLNFKETRPQSK
ncbi:hypothetical protein MIR68_004185 [Amoeboaphelidium protococcarum]|nr:hypothetical protein MIR68_004185 [Amoeboaphelidium protococcarum]